jgi:hypothetical protein
MSRPSPQGDLGGSTGFLGKSVGTRAITIFAGMPIADLVPFHPTLSGPQPDGTR